MKNNKYLNSKVSVLMLSVYLFMGSVEKLESFEGGEHLTEHEGSTGGQHTGVEPGRPSEGAIEGSTTGSKTTKSGSSHETKSESGTGGKPSGKPEGVRLGEEGPADTGKMSVEDLSKVLLESAKDVKSPEDLEKLINQMAELLDPEGITTDDVVEAAKEAARKMSSEWMNPFSFPKFQEWVESFFDSTVAESSKQSNMTAIVLNEFANKFDSSQLEPKTLFAM